MVSNDGAADPRKVSSYPDCVRVHLLGQGVSVPGPFGDRCGAGSEDDQPTVTEGGLSCEPLRPATA